MLGGAVLGSLVFAVVVGAAQPEDYEVREVVVPTRKRSVRWGSLDDPRVQAFFRSTSPIGPSMFDWRTTALSPPRPLVRLGLARTWGEGRGADRRLARRFARDLVHYGHDSLYACYVAALGRGLVLSSKVVLAVSLSEGGRVEGLQVVDGDLVDQQGNRCVVKAVAAQSVAQRGLRSPLVVRIPIWFWIQNQAAPETIMAARRGWLRDLARHRP